MNFDQKILALTAKIPHGKLVTYKSLATFAGNKKAARACGNALNKNPHPVTVPCHRVIKSDGSIGGYAFGLQRKIELLTQEGFTIADNKIKNYKNHLWDGDKAYEEN